MDLGNFFKRQTLVLILSSGVLITAIIELSKGNYINTAIGLILVVAMVVGMAHHQAMWPTRQENNEMVETSNLYKKTRESCQHFTTSELYHTMNKEVRSMVTDFYGKRGQNYEDIEKIKAYFDELIDRFELTGF